MSDAQANPCLLRWTRFKSDSHGTGPEKRSAQIKALCNAAGFSVCDMKPPTDVSRWRAYLAGLDARWRFGAHASVDRAGFGLLGFRSEFYRKSVKEHRGTRLLLWETTYDTLLPTFAKAAGFKVVALPHNLEALVSEKVFGDSGYDPASDLRSEIGRLRLADRVFLIAKEERWLLEAHRLTPFYLPFFPDPELERQCLGIRAQRSAQANTNGSIQGPLLVLGSGFNPATARGMRQQLTWLAAHAPKTEVRVVGPSTNSVLTEFRSDNVKLLGRVSREVLVTLLKTCSALLIHTYGGAGAVTRIPEALLAGIPVIANANAARDQHGNPGVYEYETEDEFMALAASALTTPPAPSRPILAETRFQGELQVLAKASLHYAR
jgi:hypothetical protein